MGTLEMPIVQRRRPWSIDGLAECLYTAHEKCLSECSFYDRRINVCLSGGLDSTTSLFLLGRLVRKLPVAAYTIGGSWRHNDIRYAKHAVQSSSLVGSHHLFVPSVQELATGREKLKKLTDQKESAGSVGVFLLYQFMSRLGVKAVIAHDGIDELLGGYWDHRKATGRTRLLAFRDRWARLESGHLQPLEQKATYFGIKVFHPYLDPAVVDYVTHIPLEDRTSRGESKKPLRALARKIGVPDAIIERQKIGFCDALSIL